MIILRSLSVFCFVGCLTKGFGLIFGNDIFLAPLFKRNQAHDPRNYRGIHITSNLSKVAERMIAFRFNRFLQLNGYRSFQWAYCKGFGARDLLCYLVNSWILAFCRGQMIGTYKGDISSAFDRVYKQFLLAKLRQIGIGDKLCDFFDAYLSARIGQVVVAGASSSEFELSDMVWQGTVLGCVLWNCFSAM